jgi:integrase
MQGKPDRKHLKLRHNTWYLNLHVPKDLKDHIGSGGKIVEALGTSDLKLAQIRRHERAAHYQTVFQRMRGEKSLDSAEIDAIARQVYEQMLRDAAKATERGKPLFRAEPDPRGNDSPEKAGLDLYQDLIGEALERQEFDVIDGEVTRVLTNAGVTVDKSSKLYQEVGYALLNAHATALRARKEILDGNEVETPRLFNEQLIDPTTGKAPTRLELSRSSDPESLRFLETSELYLTEMARDTGARMTEQTILQNRTIYRLFAQYFDDPSLKAVKARDASRFLDDMGSLRPDWSRTKAARALSIRQLLQDYKAPAGQGIKNKTLNRYVTALAQIWKWARKRGYIDTDNPFAGQSRRTGDAKAGGRKDFTVDELNTLFGSPLFTDTAQAQRIQPNQHTMEIVHLWVPLIALFSGMRLEEICKLTTTAIKEIGDVWYFDVNVDEAGRVKNRSSIRRVPVHSELKRCGLLEYRQAVSGDPSGRLFPRLQPGGPDGKFSWYYSKRFTALRRSVGINRDGVKFHSFRNTVATALENARVPVNEAAEVLGHAKAGMSYGVYSQGLGLQELQDVVERIQYPDLDLSHLYVDEG